MIHRNNAGKDADRGDVGFALQWVRLFMFTKVKT